MLQLSSSITYFSFVFFLYSTTMAAFTSINKDDKLVGAIFRQECRETATKCCNSIQEEARTKEEAHDITIGQIRAVHAQLASPISLAFLCCSFLPSENGVFLDEWSCLVH